MTLAAPFPYFGGKRRAASLIWDALGDPGGYVEPFAGSAGVLLARPGWRPTGWRRVETLNDADGWLVNTWRAIQHHPDQVAKHAHGPVTEIDYHARLAWLQSRRTPDLVAWLEGHPEACDPKAAGWWLYVMACGIGDPFGGGPWRVVDGRLIKPTDRGAHNPTDGTGQGIHRRIPHLGDTGQGIHRAIPHLGDAGKGIHRGDGDHTSLAVYMRTLAARLTRVRITCGDWERVTTPSATRAKTGGDGGLAILLDPPYSTSGDLYVHGDNNIAAQVGAYAATLTDTPVRVVMCGYDHEHDHLLPLGWRVIQGKSGSGSGYSSRSDNGRRERLWLSPACLGNQATLFGGDV